MQQTETRAPLPLSYLSRLLGVPVVSLDPLSGGRNSRVYKLTGGDGAHFLAKRYLGVTADGRSRLEAEYAGLSFLSQQGITCVPRPLAADEAGGCAIYEYVDGSRPNSAEAAGSEVDQATEFLISLHSLRHAPGADHLPRAAEACFSLNAIAGNINTRLQRLAAREGDDPESEELDGFLHRQFRPALGRILDWCLNRLSARGKSPDDELDLEERTLSPSDFGFHNCVKQPNGRLVFLDFEYFGWDDPAKMATDFLLHPAMDLGLPLKRRFLGNILMGLASQPGLADRIETVYPLFGLKWCLILLNEFLPQNLERRRFASGDSTSGTDPRIPQLAKSRKLLESVVGHYDNFPY